MRRLKANKGVRSKTFKSSITTIRQNAGKSGWFKEPHRHSLAARGIRTAQPMRTFMQRKKGVLSVDQILNMQRELRQELRDNKAVIKAIRDRKKGASDEERERLEALRKEAAERRDEVKEELQQLKEETEKARMVFTPGDEDMLRRGLLDQDKRARDERLAREREVREAVKNMDIDDAARFMEDIPRRARMRVVGPQVVGTKKADVIFTGQQGKRSGKLEKEKQERFEEALEFESRREKNELGQTKVKGLTIELTPEEEARGQLLREQREQGASKASKARKSKKSSKKSSKTGEKEDMILETRLFDDSQSESKPKRARKATKPRKTNQIDKPEPPVRNPILLQTPEDRAEAKRTREEFIFITDL